jgi:hypothetical protein
MRPLTASPQIRDPTSAHAAVGAAFVAVAALTGGGADVMSADRKWI